MPLKVDASTEDLACHYCDDANYGTADAIKASRKKLVRKVMSRDHEQKAGKKHANGDDDRARKGISKSSVHIPTIESHKGGEDDQGGREDVADGNAVDKGLLEHPSSAKYGFGLDERNGGKCTSKG
ncbi:hypothetical protein M408DRAFT_30018 [Serendipita vermifera MAFF 305830]|uniref:Uncharacterized protein n=1 Tax=Serendipita vermifera MAFF 305830 TaxID=933852 RepID=A0A0C2W305_SERVB|nr:hypothetical protein M408DRAFT_30018 [Serendipita vermifera MAFF 305830]